MDSLSFSIVIPLFNKAKYIARAINSVLSQTHQNFELIIINDGSTDNSLEIAESHSDSRIRIISQPNCGESAARNRGIEDAFYEYVCFLDADDEWLESHLMQLSLLISVFPHADVLSTNFVTIVPPNYRIFSGVSRPQAQQLVDDYLEYLAYGTSPVNSSNVCIKKNALQSINGFPLGIQQQGDLSTWIKLSLSGYKFAFTPCVTVRIHKDSQSKLERAKRGLHEVELPYEQLLIDEFNKTNLKRKTWITMTLNRLYRMRAVNALYCSSKEIANFWRSKIKPRSLPELLDYCIIMILCFLPKNVTLVVFWISRNSKKLIWCLQSKINETKYSILRHHTS